MSRVFIAINLPEQIKKELENLKKEVQNLFPQEVSRGVVRWVKEENFHLTLLFVGSIPDQEIFQVCQIVKETVRNQKPFSLKFKKLCYGPPQKIPPRLIWLEIEKNSALSRLAENLKKKAKEKGILRKIENRGFSPHITLGRISTWQWRSIEPEERPEIEKEVSLSFDVKSIEVMKSVLKRSGAEYTILQSIILGS